MNQEITFLNAFFARLFWRNALRRHVRRIEQRIRFAAAATFKPNRADCIVELGAHQQLCHHLACWSVWSGRSAFPWTIRARFKTVCILPPMSCCFCSVCILPVFRLPQPKSRHRQTDLERLNPLLNKLLPIKSVPACFGVGVLWGWLPCGLVYSASLYALGSGNALHGGLYMLAFALGTLPNLLAMGIFAAQLKPFCKNAWFVCAPDCWWQDGRYGAWLYLRWGKSGKVKRFYLVCCFAIKKAV